MGCLAGVCTEVPPNEEQMKQIVELDVTNMTMSEVWLFWCVVLKNYLSEGDSTAAVVDQQSVNLGPAPRKQ